MKMPVAGLRELLLLATGCYAVHIAEEGLFDFPAWLWTSFRVRVSWREFWVLNSVVVPLGLGASAIANAWPAVALGFPALMILNAVLSHVGLTVVKRRFSPGLITGLMLFLPQGWWCFRTAWLAGVPVRLVPLSFLIGGLLLLFPLVWFRLIRPRIRV